MKASGAVAVSLILSVGSTASQQSASPRANTISPEANFAKGVVTDARGRPLVGAKIVVGSTVYYNSNIRGGTNAKGEYRVRLTPQDSWRAYASIERSYHGRTYVLDLHPVAYNTFSSAEGGVQNFVWKLSGDKEGAKHGTYGGAVLAIPVEKDFDTIIEARFVELTLRPVGPLIDGSPGSVVTKLVRPSPNGTGVFDVPLGQYRVTARYVAPERSPVDMLVRAAGTEAWNKEVVRDFEPARSGAGTYEIRLDVTLP